MENKDFAERNVGLVRALVPRFLGRGIEYDDLFQAGCEGLIKAAAHFDPDRGYKFSTYAVPVILGEMRRLFREGGTVKVSRGLKELSMKAVHLSEQIETETGKAPSVSVLAEKLGVPEEKCAEALNAAAQPVSLTGEYFTLIVIHKDAPGAIAEVTRILTHYSGNICHFDLSRKARGGEAIMTLSMDALEHSDIPALCAEIEAHDIIYKCIAVQPIA